MKILNQEHTRTQDPANLLVLLSLNLQLTTQQEWMGTELHLRSMKKRKPKQMAGILLPWVSKFKATVEQVVCCQKHQGCTSFQCSLQKITAFSL